MDNALAPQSPVLRMQRSRGRVMASWHRKDGATRLCELHQQGSARAIPLPGPEVVVLNTSGGLTGGDHFSIMLSVEADCCVTATTQTAERIYRSPGDAARIEIAMTVGPGGHLDWLPQETILFDHAHARRDTRIDLCGDAGCLMVETLVLGRAAMGETVTDVTLLDRRGIYRDGQPLHLDPVRIDRATLTPSPSGLDGARALASVVMVTRGAEDALCAARASLTEPGVRAAASAFDGKLTLRLMAGDAYPLRRQLMRLLTVLRRAPLPRVWQS